MYIAILSILFYCVESKMEYRIVYEKNSKIQFSKIILATKVV